MITTGIIIFWIGFAAGLIPSLILCFIEMAWLNSRIEFWHNEALKNLQMINQIGRKINKI